MVVTSLGADIMVAPRHPEQIGLLKETPRLLVEIMRPSEVTASGKDEIAHKIQIALDGQTKAAWLVYHKENSLPIHGIQVHVGKYNPDAPILEGDEVLDDGGLDLNITARQALTYI